MFSFDRFFSIQLHSRPGFETQKGPRLFLTFEFLIQKPKTIRKMIQQHFKKFSNLSDFECRFKFLEILKSVYRYDQERFRCALGVSWDDDVRPLKEDVYGLDVEGETFKASVQCCKTFFCRNFSTWKFRQNLKGS